MTFESPPAKTLKHIAVLDTLRGLAALAVVFFHYSGSILPTLRPNPFEIITDQGRFGVHVFFVISGFVIPYSLYRSNYHLNGLGRFMARRAIRIAPPAYMASLLVILYHQASIWIQGRPVRTDGWPGLDLLSILGNLTFHPDLFGTQWFNFPYWTLMVEFQFYLLIGLALPLLLKESKFVRTTLLPLGLLVLSAFIDTGLLPFLPFFFIGVFLFMYDQCLLPGRSFLYLMAITFTFSLQQGWIAAIIGILTAAIIAFGTDHDDRITKWLGLISYSLYITHVPVAYFSETFFKHVFGIPNSNGEKFMMLMVYVLIALLCAAGFHRMIERPFTHLSKKI